MIELGGTAVTSGLIALATTMNMWRHDPDTPILIETLRSFDVKAEPCPWEQPQSWGRFDLVVSRTPWGYHERPQQFLAWIDDVERSTRFANPRDLIAWNMHKGYLLELRESGILIPETSMFTQGAEWQSTIDGEIVIKPAISAGARRTLRVHSSSDDARLHMQSLLRDGDALVQPYLDEVARDGEISLIYFGGRFSHSVRKLAATGDFRVQQSHGGRLEAHDATSTEIEFGLEVLERCPEASLYARIDIVRSRGNLLLMEAELIEPELFLPYGGAERYAASIVAMLEAFPRHNGTA